MKKRNIFSRQAVNFLWVLLGLGAGLQFIEVIWAASKGYLGFFSMMVVVVTEIVITGSIYVIIYKFLIKPCNETRKLFKHFIQSGSFQELIDQDYQIFPEQNEVMQKLDSILDKKNIIELSTKHAELLALQNQINPHFLYNTLDSVSILARRNKDAQVADIVTNLSRLFRLGLHQGRECVTVRDELSHVTYYLKIQKIRFEEYLDWEIEAAPEVMDYKTMKFILQPIVENAINHGLRAKGVPGYVRVSVRETEEDIIFTVSDTGNGMSPDTVRILRERIDRKTIDEQQEQGFGLWNVNQRVKLYYGDAYGITIESVQEKGTDVSVRIHKT